MTIIKSIAGNITSFLNAVPGIKKLRVVGRFTGILGMIVQIGSSALQSVTSLDPMIFIRTFGLNLVRVNQGLIADMSALQAGASGATFWWHTLGIYSKLWFILFITSIIATYLRNMHFGNQVPKYQLYLVTFVLIITPIQMLGAVIVEVVKTGSLKRGQLWQVLNFWKGIQMVAGNPDIWLRPSLEYINMAPSISDPTTQKSLNKSVEGIQTISR